MKQPTFCGRELLPLSVIEAARAGDPLAVERVLWYYEGYMDKLCTRTLYDLDGAPCAGLHLHRNPTGRNIARIARFGCAGSKRPKGSGKDTSKLRS